MSTEQIVKLSAQSKPRILGEEMVKRIATVTRDAITVNVTSSKFVSSTITYISDPKYPNWDQIWDEGISTDIVKHHECNEEPLVINLNENDYGSHFTFHVVSRDPTSGIVTENYQFSLRAELNKAEMESFLRNILKRINNTKMEPAMFYRNFTSVDEIRVESTNNGFFELVRKEKSGHRSSPLYQKLDNITYFSCTLFKLTYPEWQEGGHQLPYLPDGYKLPPMSPFGDQRVTYKASQLLNEESVLFLGGMHCYTWAESRPHYVTVVVCQKGSLSYHTCLELGLIQLNWERNPILQWNASEDKLYCATELILEGHQEYPHSVWIEVIFCDKAIALKEGQRSTCKHKNYESYHISSMNCDSCHGYTTDNMNEGIEIEKPPLKRKSLEDNCTVSAKEAKENE